MATVESTEKKRLKVNEDDEDDIDLSKGEDRERHVMNQESNNQRF